MAVIREATLNISGTIRRVDVDHDQKGTAYATVQIENEGGISDVAFSADNTQKCGAVDFKPGTSVNWQVRPYVVYGISQRSGAAYGFRKLNYCGLGALGGGFGD